MQRFLFGLTAIMAIGLLSSETASAQAAVEPRSDAIIQYYATLDRGLAEAKRTGKPILFVSAAPHCAGVSGMW
ncbi:MAG: hypothetical protein NT142_17505 [Planctomycetota bacterium]|nr:hypothetical protein [Planctomycetota bacterium]